MRLPLRSVCFCALPLALAACHGEKKPAEARTAQGEILPGSASDAMLPLDSVRSQPPLAPEAEASGKPGKASRGNKSDEAGAEASEDAATAATPSPAAAPSVAAAPTAAQ